MNAVMRAAPIYLAFGSVAVKRMLQFRIYFWMGLVSQIILMVAWLAFWQAAYHARHTIGGLQEAQTLRYILLARILAPTASWNLTQTMGGYIRQGLIAAELLRPTDFQLRFYAESLSRTVASFIQLSIPSALIAVVFLGLRLPTDPGVWMAFLLTYLLGNGVLFCYDYLTACLAFYTTEVWGLAVLQVGIFTFASGALVPLTLMPDWLRLLTNLLPFSQALFVPVGLLSGITPVADLGRLCLVELGWLLGLAVLSRLTFRIAVRAVTVQGG